jgi:hypothetical protein
MNDGRFPAADPCGASGAPAKNGNNDQNDPPTTSATNGKAPKPASRISPPNSHRFS